jgi:two-component system response regulator FixJ
MPAAAVGAAPAISSKRAIMNKGLIYILDDDPAVRDSLMALFESYDFQALSFASADEFLSSCSHQEPDCAILDIRMSGVSGLELLSIMRQRKITLPVVVITAHGDVATAVQSMKLGAIDVIQKPFSHTVLMSAVQTALNQGPGPSLPPRTETRDEGLTQRLRSLSPREREILDLIVTGKSSRDISGILSISTATVNNHRCQIKTKMGARTVAHLLAMMNSAGKVS